MPTYITAEFYIGSKFFMENEETSVIKKSISHAPGFFYVDIRLVQL
jgi:hypothetical protein